MAVEAVGGSQFGVLQPPRENSLKKQNDLAALARNLSSPRWQDALVESEERYRIVAETAFDGDNGIEGCLGHNAIALLAFHQGVLPARAGEVAGECGEVVLLLEGVFAWRLENAKLAATHGLYRHRAVFPRLH